MARTASAAVMPGASCGAGVGGHLGGRARCAGSGRGNGAARRRRGRGSRRSRRRRRARSGEMSRPGGGPSRSTRAATRNSDLVVAARKATSTPSLPKKSRNGRRSAGSGAMVSEAGDAPLHAGQVGRHQPQDVAAGRPRGGRSRRRWSGRCRRACSAQVGVGEQVRERLDLEDQRAQRRCRRRSRGSRPRAPVWACSTARESVRHLAVDLGAGQAGDVRP